jgi:hypothetical protein
MENRTLLATLVVTNTDDSGMGSLRQAILDSNAATADANTIDFQIPGQGVRTIAPLSPLPAITHAVLIDGFSQPGYTGTPLIELSGSQAGPADGLTITGSGSTVRGLDINGFGSGAGIHIMGTGATGEWIYSDLIGTDPAASSSLPNRFGILIRGGQSNLIGTNHDGQNDAAEGNLISGNTEAGIAVDDTATPFIDGHLDPSAAQNADLTGEGTIDWSIWGYANGGTSTSLAPDVRKAGGSGISDLTSLSNGNPLRGLGQFGAYAHTFDWSDGTSPVTATGAVGGLQHDGEQPPGASNVGEGFSFTVPADTTPRTLRLYVTAHEGQGELTATLSDGSAAPYSEILDGTDQSNYPGVYTINYETKSPGQTLNVSYTLVSEQSNASNAAIYAATLGWAGATATKHGGQPSRLNGIAGNRIGTDQSGSSAIPNGIGVEVEGSSKDTLIGGASLAAGNLIAFNTGPGVTVLDQSAGTQVSANRIFSNGGLAIDLGGDGITSNAPAPRQGPNDLQNYPIVVTAADGSLRGWLGGSRPDAKYHLEIFASASFASDGSGEAQQFLGSLEVTTDSNGQARFDVPFAAPPDLPIITATATDPQGNTSEVSAQRQDTLDVPTRALLDRPGQPLVFSSASGDDIAVQDPGVGPLDPAWDVTLSVTAGTLTLSTTAGLSGSGDGTGSLSYRGSLSAIDAALASLTYTPAPGFQGGLVLDLTAGSDGASSLRSQIPIYVSDGHFVVTTTADSGPGSLRQAILYSNSLSGQTNTIEFAIPGGGVQRIAPLSSLPAITQAVLIDGFSQPGYAGSPLIELSGNNLGGSA